MDQKWAKFLGRMGRLIDSAQKVEPPAKYVKGNFYLPGWRLFLLI